MIIYKKILSGVSVDAGGGGQGPPGQQGPYGVGFKLTSDGDYDQDALSKKTDFRITTFKMKYNGS